MGTSFREILETLRQRRTGWAGFSLVSNQDNGTVSFASGLLTYTPAVQGVGTRQYERLVGHVPSFMSQVAPDSRPFVAGPHLTVELEESSIGDVDGGVGVELSATEWGNTRLQLLLPRLGYDTASDSLVAVYGGPGRALPLGTPGRAFYTISFRDAIQLGPR